MIDMPRHYIMTRALPLFILLTGISMPACADIFDNPQNLDVLPTDISPAALRDTMRSFATDTGSTTTTNFNDSSLSNGTQYFYAAFAYDAATIPNYSTAVTATASPRPRV
ncbi:MAG: hypothetical protein IIA09_13925 [Proteobacteria bacterium]|nr:hypothetical protein [Pseudomonadota bacterium]